MVRSTGSAIGKQMPTDVDSGCCRNDIARLGRITIDACKTI